MMPKDFRSHRASSIALAALLFALSLIEPSPAHATNLLNVYAGAAYSRANLRAHDLNRIPLSGSGILNAFSRPGSGYQFTLGVRGLGMLGAEIDYFDLGHGEVSHPYGGANTPATVTGATLGQKGEAAFAMLYLPVPIVDVYLKAGVDRMSSNLSARIVPQVACAVTGCTAQPLSVHATSTGLALGAGVQWTLGNWGVRADYERLSALGEHPDLVSVGVIWTFL